MKFVGLPHFLLLTAVGTMSFFLLPRQIEGQSLLPHSVFEEKSDVQGIGTLLRDRNLKAKSEKASKDAKVGKDGKVGKAGKGPKSYTKKTAKKSQNIFGSGDPSPEDLDFLDFDATIDLVPLDASPISMTEKLPCEESLEGDWIYDCGSCNCNKWLVTIECQGAGDSRMCSYVEREYPGDCGFDPEFSNSWASPCTLSGEFRAAEISQTNATTYGATCEMSLFEPIVLETGESCSKEFAQHIYAVKARFSAAFVGFLGSQSMYLHKSKDNGSIFDSLQIASRVDDEGYNDPSFCNSCTNVGIESTGGCSFESVVPFDFRNIIIPPEVTDSPSSSPTAAPTKSSVSLCNGKLKSTVGFAADTITEIIKLQVTPPATQAGIQIVSGFLSLVYDLACQSAEEPPVPQMLADDIRRIAREESKDVVNLVMLAQLQALSGELVAWSGNGGLPIGVLLRYAEKANMIENQVATLGIIGIHPMITAAGIKIFLMGLLSEYIVLRPDGNLGPCCSLAQDKYEFYMLQLRANFIKMRNDLAEYRTTSGNFKTYKTSHEKDDTTCPSNCMDYGACCWCSAPFAGYWNGRNGKKAVTSARRCAVTDGSTKVIGISKLMVKLVEGFFIELERAMFLPKVLEMEASVAKNADPTLSCHA